MIGELHRTRTSHGHDDVFLDLVGGLHVAITRLDAMLARYAPAVSPDAAHAPCSSPELVELVLGLVAVRDRIAAALAVDAAGSSAQRPASPPPGSLLR